jgi:hypothetical protein
MRGQGRRMIAVLFLFLILLEGCAHRQQALQSPFEASPSLAPDLSQRVLSLDPDSISEKDVAEILSKCPAPRILILEGSIPIVSMESFTRFLIRMGYPEDRVRNPLNGSLTYSSHQDSREMAGMIAWFYEREGMRPMPIGYSGGGMLSVKVLHELAGTFHEEIPVWNPVSREAEERSAIIDPLTGVERPIIGLKIGFASAIATGKTMRYLLGQWNMVPLLRKVPDSVEAFTGFHIKNDLISGTLLGVGDGDRYQATGSAAVRNVILPAECSHLGLPATEDLAENRQAREWIDRYVPSDGESQSPFPEVSGNIIFAADLWYSIKKHWCLELKRWILAHGMGEKP